MHDRKSELMHKPNLPPRVSTDVVSELLLGMRLFGVDYRRVLAARPFGLRFTTVSGRAQFHFVARGPVYLRNTAGDVRVMNSGDAVLLPRGGVHALVSDPDAPDEDMALYKADPLCANISGINTCGAAEDAASGALLFSGCMEFDLGGMHPLVSLMPEAMFVNTLLDRYPEILPMLEAMAREAKEARAGYAGILARLADVVSAFIVRGWVECGCGDAKGWVEALRDPRLGRVIVALHRDPGRDWTLAELAAEMGSSRSVFAERFMAVTGTTPVRYLTQLRMQLATQWIARDGVPIDTAAQRLGYNSQAAFSRAFKRVVGVPPSAVRAGAQGAASVDG
ncbi:AraC family transcriptional regulator [Pelagibacterium xiamenense]|uniref:AraC family transcriptional regulator n=1 Tax=Pelagibacterium xiamenense TaxID=2901140 RepID=UPI001E629EFF|nr:AraC family transcriptional regulator [Pelagibacterium xiamenense]MCD7060270.1 AraC family transcriptional regulator [Pelagibacterium xiamenense]